ncbi:MAG TPA: 3-deoxy-manno-octulosonate cytidylyltransferase, partial [Candidatus Omnitrophota bacterium]|nr:3-deoxy-manno-octulosonate cytidylyltransferase [Candidatus Omnitrophota bacterium]
ARYGSTRFPGKVLALIQGRPMIEHVYRQAKKSRSCDEILIACDDPRVMDAAAGFGASAVMTSPDHPSGTDRIAQAVENVPADIIINIQGDEPLIAPDMIDALAGAIRTDASCVMATVARKITDPAEVADPNVVKVVLDGQGNALYFSRSVIPFNRDKISFEEMQYWKHFGLYAYRKDFLMKLKTLPPSALEQSERLEQLRVLQAGYKIKVVLTDQNTISVDTAEDLLRVEAVLAGEKAGRL